MRKARIDSGLEIKELAKILGVTGQTVINWEIRGMTPSEQKVDRVNQFLMQVESLENCGGRFDVPHSEFFR